MAIPGFSGSARARNIIRNARARTDSVDVLTIGDSNIGFNNYGYGGGIYKAMQGLCTEYATGILPSALSGASASFTGTILGDGLTFNWIGHNTVSAASAATIKQLVTEAGSNATAQQITTALGMNLSLLPSMLGDTLTYAGVYLHSDINTSTNVWTSAANNNCIIFGATGCPMNVSSGSMQSRIVHGRFSTGSGSFKHLTWSTVNSSSSQSTSGGPSIATSKWNFTSPSGPAAYRVGWDGFSQGASFYPTGPIAILMQSVIRLGTLGFSHTNLMRDPGKSTTELADRVEAMDKLLDEYLRESRDRQIESGGSGNVVVVITSGINGSETSSSYMANVQRIINRVRQRWATVSGDWSKLAFILVPTHPVTAVINTWTSGRSDIVASANTLAMSQSGVCVYDIGVAHPAATINANGWYDAGGQAHLTSTGYATISSTLINNLVA